MTKKHGTAGLFKDELAVLLYDVVVMLFVSCWNYIVPVPHKAHLQDGADGETAPPNIKIVLHTLSVFVHRQRNVPLGTD